MSVASGSRGQSTDRSEAAGPSKLSKEHKALLLEYLGIDTALPSLGPPGLRSTYQKFKAIINGIPTVTDLGKDAEWKSQFEDTTPWIPSVLQFIEIFVAKTQFYQFWRPLLSRAQDYPDMKDWLDQHKDRMSTKELWNTDSSRPITFPDLKNWLDEKDRAVNRKQDAKGKRKAPASPPKSKKKKNHDRDRAVVQRKHKKSKPASESDGSE